MKKFLALVLALMMILSLATTAMATDVEPATTDLTIKDRANYAEDREYEAYMILTASVDGLHFAYQVNDTYKGILIDVLGLKNDATINEITAAIALMNTDAKMRDFAETLFDKIQADDGLEADASWTGETVKLQQAYWLIVDVTDLDGENYSNSLVMVDTVGDVAVTIQNKPNTTTTEKKLDDENDSILDPSAISEDAVNLQDVADYDIGDDVPYTIDIDMANNIVRYDYYAFIIQDRVEEGLTYNTDSFKITVRGDEKKIALKDTEGADFWYEIEEYTYGDDKTGQKLYVYPAHGYTTHELNTSTTDILDDYITLEANKDNGGDFLKLFAEGTPAVNINSSEVIFTYTCELNENAVIGIAGNPNYYTLKFSNNPYDDSWGETPEDTNFVLTYKFIYNKVDTDNKPLTGADFKLEKFVAVYPADYDTENIPEGYVQHPYLLQWGTYEEVKYKTTSEGGTVFTFSGLDDGLYRLTETEVPDGFNGIDPIEFRIIGNHITAVNGDSLLTSLQVNTQYTGQMEVNYNTTACSMTTNIQNHSGTELPTTGGIGTTLFYIIGGVLALGAVVLLVTKKRMNAEG